MERDYQKDLEVCEKATKGQWEHKRDVQGNDKFELVFQAIYINGERILRLNCENAENIASFIALAGTSLPWYIKRCMELDEIITDRTKDIIYYDKKNKELQSQLQQAEEREAALMRQLKIAAKEISGTAEDGDICPSDFDGEMTCTCNGTIADVYNCWRKRWAIKAFTALDKAGETPND